MINKGRRKRSDRRRRNRQVGIEEQKEGRGGARDNKEDNKEGGGIRGAIFLPDRPLVYYAGYIYQ